MTKEKKPATLFFLKNLSKLHESTWTVIEDTLRHHIDSLDSRTHKERDMHFGIITMSGQDAITLRRPFKTKNEALDYVVKYIERLKHESSQ